MAKIKSTIDIVMEKTKHLTLSEDEKSEKAREDIQKAVKGLIQAYHDNSIKMQELKDRIETLNQEEKGIDVYQIMKDEILDHIALTKDNTLLFESLSNLYNLDTSGLESVLSDCLREINEFRNSYMIKFKQILEQEEKISGSAVIPNLDADEEFLRLASAIQEKYEVIFKQKKAEIAA